MYYSFLYLDHKCRREGLKECDAGIKRVERMITGSFMDECR